MNNKVGLSAVLDAPGSLNILALSLRSRSVRTRALVLEIFGAVCLLPGGHAHVLEAMSELAENMGAGTRMEIIVHGLIPDSRRRSVWDTELQVRNERCIFSHILNLIFLLFWILSPFLFLFCLAGLK